MRAGSSSGAAACAPAAPSRAASGAHSQQRRALADSAGSIPAGRSDAAACRRTSGRRDPSCPADAARPRSAATPVELSTDAACSTLAAAGPSGSRRSRRLQEARPPTVRAARLLQQAPSCSRPASAHGAAVLPGYRQWAGGGDGRRGSTALGPSSCRRIVASSSSAWPGRRGGGDHKGCRRPCAPQRFSQRLLSSAPGTSRWVNCGRWAGARLAPAGVPRKPSRLWRAAGRLWALPRRGKNARGPSTGAWVAPPGCRGPCSL